MNEKNKYDEAAKKQIEELTNELIRTNSYGTLNAVAEHLYNAEYRKQEWISVEERLPECEWGAESNAVLFITKAGFMYTGYYGCGGIYRDRYFREYKNSTEGYDISSVTHWMPLPDAPKMKGGTHEE